jgi:hypothetical protein
MIIVMVMIVVVVVVIDNNCDDVNTRVDGGFSMSVARLW